MTCRLIIAVIFCSFIILNSCSLHFVANRSKVKQNLRIVTSFSDSFYSLNRFLKNTMTPKNGVDNIVVGHNQDATIILFDLQPGRNINIGSLVHHCTDKSGLISNWLLIEQKVKEGEIDTVLYQKGERKIVSRAKVYRRLFWTKYFYEFR